MTQYQLCITHAIATALMVAVLLYILLPKKSKKIRNADRLESIELYCFQCEIKTAVVERKNNFYCRNCGLKH